MDLPYIHHPMRTFFVLSSTLVSFLHPAKTIDKTNGTIKTNFFIFFSSQVFININQYALFLMPVNIFC